MHEAAAIAAAFCWSCGFVIARPLLGQLSVFRLNILRLSGPAILFPLLLLSLGLGHLFGELELHNIAALGVTAVAGIGLVDLGMIHAMRLVGVSRAYTMSNVSTLFALLWAYLLLGELINSAVIWAALLMATGVGLTTLRGGSGQGEASYGSRQFWLGISLAAGVACIWGLDIIFLRVGVGDAHPLAANAVRLPMALLVATTAMLIREPAGQKLNLPTISQAGRGLLGGLIGIGIGAMLFLYALQGIGAARAGVLAALSPIFGMVLAAIFLHERPNRQQMLGVLLAVGGVVLISNS